jgi:hypothetical protein
MTGFLFSFKMYIPKHDGELDCIENMVHHITRSDLIHVEVIPILSSCQELLYASQDAHTAYVGIGYSKHASSHCLEDDSYMHLFVPVDHPDTMQRGVQFLESLHGMRYNYLALPLTMLPDSCKLRRVDDSTPLLQPTSKIFCSQMGLMLCYLCQLLSPQYHYHGASTIFDPTCCTPADLYRLLVTQHPRAIHCDPSQIHILQPSDEWQAQLVDSPTIYYSEATAQQQHGEQWEPPDF